MRRSAPRRTQGAYLKGYVAGVEGFPGDGEFDIEDPFRGQADDYEEVAAEIKSGDFKAD